MTGTESAGDSLERALQSAELERARLENEKLQLELAALKNKRGKLWSGMTDRMIPIVTTLLAIGGFAWGIVQYQLEQQKNRSAQKEQAEREFMKPWLESQWDIYLRALAAAATAANSDDAGRRKDAADEFWELYQGKMILVETKDVSGAMVAFGRCLNGRDTCDTDEKNNRVHALGTKMAESMANTAAMNYKDFAESQFKYAANP